jgi:hypothetical protein
MNGYAYNEDELSGKMPESHWVVSDVVVQGLLTIDEQEFLKNKVLEDDALRKEQLAQENASRIARGLPPKVYKKNPNRWLKGIMWDVLDDEEMLVRKNKCLCATRSTHSKFHHRNKGCGISVAIKPLLRVILDYINLNEWDNLCNFQQLAQSSLPFASSFNCFVKMSEVIAQGILKIATQVGKEHKFIELGEKYPQLGEMNSLLGSFKDAYVSNSLEPTPVNEELIALHSNIVPANEWKTQFIALYNLSLKLLNSDKEARLKVVNLEINNIVSSLATVGYSLPLAEALKIREEEAKTITESMGSRLVNEFLVLEKQINGIKAKIEALKIGYDEDAVENLFNSQKIKIYINGHRGDDFITIKSDEFPVPQFVVSYKDWRTKYVVQSLKDRPQHFQKGHKYHCQRGAVKI